MLQGRSERHAPPAHREYSRGGLRCSHLAQLRPEVMIRDTS